MPTNATPAMAAIVRNGSAAVFKVSVLDVMAFLQSLQDWARMGLWPAPTSAEPPEKPNRCARTSA
jgi:hypothetical protein